MAERKEYRRMNIYELDSTINDLMMKVEFGEATEEEKSFLWNIAHDIEELFKNINYNI